MRTRNGFHLCSKCLTSHCDFWKELLGVCVCVGVLAVEGISSWFLMFSSIWVGFQELLVSI